LPFIYGFPFLFGFVNFTLSVALAFLAFGLWLRLGQLGRTRLRGWLFAPISLLVFFCHVYGWGLLCLMCFSAAVVRRRDRGRSWWRSAIEGGLQTSVMSHVTEKIDQRGDWRIDQRHHRREHDEREEPPSFPPE
jgi:thiol:disulfide interchange protein